MISPKIAIIGAGPSGLTLARLLQQHNIPSTIFEAEPSRSDRNQGGSLDLHPHLGQLALKEAGLLPAFQKIARAEGEATKIIKFDGTILWDDNDMVFDEGEDRGGGRPEIDRIDLRNLLLDSLVEGVVQWGKKLSSVEAGREEGKWKLSFVDGTVEEDVDLVVGADGAWSKVRPLITDAKPFYSGITAIEMWALDVDRQNPWLSEYVGQGTCFMFDEGRALIVQRNGNGSTRAYAGMRQPVSWLEDKEIANIEPKQIQELLLEEYFADCGEDLKRVVRESSDQLIPRKMWMLPVGLKWEARAGVTLLGDAAHLMTPFAGVGVNLAMADALGLANALITRKNEDLNSKSVVLAAIKEYEAVMFERGEKNAQKTWKNTIGHFSAYGGEERVAILRKHFETKATAKSA